MLAVPDAGAAGARGGAAGAVPCFHADTWHRPPGQAGIREAAARPFEEMNACTTRCYPAPHSQVLARTGSLGEVQRADHQPLVWMPDSGAERDGYKHRMHIHVEFSCMQQLASAVSGRSVGIDLSPWLSMTVLQKLSTGLCSSNPFALARCIAGMSAYQSAVPSQHHFEQRLSHMHRAGIGAYVLAGDGCACTGRPFHGATLPIGYDAEPTRHRIGEATAGRMKPAGDGDVCADCRRWIFYCGRHGWL